MKMDQMIHQLLRVLERESELYRAILTVIDKERNAAVSHKGGVDNYFVVTICVSVMLCLGT